MTLKEHIDDIRKGLHMFKYGKCESETSEAKYKSSEAIVSQCIVLRLLDALGWQIYNRQLVFPQYPIGERKVDFALCHPPLKPLIFIEVKRVGKLRERNTEGLYPKQQLFKYVRNYDRVIPIAVLTDGREWQFFHPTKEGTSTERKVCELHFITEDSAKNAERLNRYLNYEAIRTGEAVAAIKADYKEIVQRSQMATRFLETKLEVAQAVAYLWWCKETRDLWSCEKVEEMIPSQFSLKCILKSDAYAHHVKQLMQTYYDTPKKFYEWRDNYGKDMPKKFGDLMRLSPEKAQQIINEVAKEYNSTTHEDNKDAKNKNT